MKRVVVIGGGHARVVLEILAECPDLDVAGFTSSENSDETSAACGVAWLGTDAILPGLLENGVRNAFVAIGDNRRRVECAAHVEALGFELVNAVSRHAVLSRSVRIGAGVAIMPGAVINSASQLQNCAIINTNASVDHDCVIGTGVHVGPGCALAGKVKVGDGSFLGIGARVIPGVSIGAWATVGAGAVVLADLPDGVTAVGVPARIRGSK